LQSRSRSLSRSGSSRIVTEDLMSYDVLRAARSRQRAVQLRATLEGGSSA
jgi:hypothetical protein